jgi:aspartyl-tRNA(Asn)/glutamyl-tRNA(Gln) amidotransferase subunit B
LASIRETVPELPRQKRERFETKYALTPYQVQLLTATQPLSDYFEKAAAAAGDPQGAANWIITELMAKPETFDKIAPEATGTLVRKINEKEISGKMAKDIFAKMYDTGKSPEAIIEGEGLRQISDTGALEKIVDEVLAANAKQVEQYKSGKTTVIGYLVGQVMKASKGQANPAAVNDLLRTKLG